MGRERERRGRLRPERGGRHARRPRIARRARPRRPLPRRAPRREPGWRVDRPSRVPDLRHARRAPLGHDRAPRRRVRVPHVRLRRAERRAPLVAPVGDAARRRVRGAAARPRRRPGRARDLRDRPGRRGRLAGRPFRRRRRRRARGRAARAAELRRLDLRARSRDRPDGGLSRGERIGVPAARRPSPAAAVALGTDGGEPAPGPEPRGQPPLTPDRTGPYRHVEPGGAEKALMAASDRSPRAE